MAYSAKDFIRNPMSLKASVIWNVLWTIAIMLALVGMLVIGLVTKLSAQEREFTGPVAEGNWVIPDEAVTVCPMFVDPGQIDPNFCVFIRDQWGPYPDEAMCSRRMAQDFPIIATQQTGVPHWALTTSCELSGEEV